MSTQGQSLFDLLPAVYRLRDAALSSLSPSELGELRTLQTAPPPLSPAQQQQLNRLLAKSRGPLESLLMLIEEQLAVLAEDLDQLYDDQFIETCASWVIPYIGDLIGYEPVHGVAPAVASPRAEVANTIAYRRRKGTALVLEQLARDVTGWGAHAVEFFKLLAVTQYMKDIRPNSYYAPNLRCWQPGVYMDTAFDATAHTVDVHLIAAERGRYNIRNIGIFLWSLNAYRLTMATAAAAGPAFTLTVNGAGFLPGATVQWNGAALATNFVNPTQLTAGVPSNLIAATGTASITVVNPGKVTSVPVSLSIDAANPIIASLGAASATAGGPAFTITVNGTGFLLGAAIQWNGSPLATSFINPTQLTAAVPASLIAAAGTAGITVVNPGIPASGPISFPINTPTPVIAGLSPSSATTGGPPFSLTVTGAGFLPSAAVQWDGAALTTSFVDATQLTAAVPANLIAATGAPSIAVVNPGGAASDPVPFAIDAPTPVIGSLSPSSATVGGPALTLTVNGTGFLPDATVQWNGAALTTSFANPTQLTAAVPANLIAATGAASIAVANPGGAADSGTVSFPINAATPVIDGLSPSSATAGGPDFTLTVNGTGFLPETTVQWNGAALVTSLVAPTQLIAGVPANLILTTGAAGITAVNPTNETTDSFQFPINEPTPAIASLSPGSAPAGGPALTLTVLGTGFQPDAAVQWNGVAQITSFVDATQLAAAVPANLIAAAGSASITVVNPGNVTSAAGASFSIDAPTPVIAGLTPSAATAGGAGGQFFRFSPLGADMPLFNNPVSQGSQITAAAQPVNVPDRLLRPVLCQDLRSGTGAVYYGAGNSLALYLNNTLINAYQIQVCDLSGDDGDWANVPAAGSPYAACIDPELGRIALPPPSVGSPAPQVQTSFYYGFNADMGGGEYSRSETFTVQTETSVLPFPDNSSQPQYSTLQDALDFAVKNLDGSGQLAVEITDSGTYPLLTAPPLQIDVPAGATIELRAADGCRPTLVLGSAIAITGGLNSVLALNGLLLTYAPPLGGSPVPPPLIHVPNQAANQLSQLELNHCTLVPGLALTPQGAAQFGGHPALVVELPGLQVIVQQSIVGGMRIQELATASLSDSILDACGPTAVAYADVDANGFTGGGSLTLNGCTVIGKIHATLLTLVSDSIVWAGFAAGDLWSAPLWADRKQQGCVRFSYLPAYSIVPRQFECVKQGEGVPQPIFYSLRYGDPGYGKLWPSTDDSIRRGADDGGEMGAFHFVLAPLRETDLLVRLQEYLPVGLESGIFYQT